VPAGEETEEGAHGGEAAGARGVAGTRGRIRRKPCAQIGLSQGGESGEVGLRAQVLREEAKEAGDVGAVGLHGQWRCAALLAEPCEKGAPVHLSRRRER